MAFNDSVPKSILLRRDKMGFPVPLAEWARTSLKPEIYGTLESLRDRDLDFINGDYLEQVLQSGLKFSRGLWALLSVELWMQSFHDRHVYVR